VGMGTAERSHAREEVEEGGGCFKFGARTFFFGAAFFFGAFLAAFFFGAAFFFFGAFFFLGAWWCDVGRCL